MSKIEWTEETWNPIAGCELKSPGCTNCYAMKMARRVKLMNEKNYKNPAESPYFGTTRVVNGKVVWTGELGIAPEHTWRKPFTMKKPRMIFVNSMSDLFWEKVPDEVIDRVMATILCNPQHIYQILTKRPDRMRDYMNHHMMPVRVYHMMSVVDPERWHHNKEVYHKLLQLKHFKIPNLWLGTSVEDTKRASERLPILAQVQHAAVRWASFEPLLERIAVRSIADTYSLHWAVLGSESGPEAREIEISDMIATANSLQHAGVPIFVKQVRSVRRGRPLKSIDEFPFQLQVRDWPKQYQEAAQ